ncbi:MAG: hypothetical protein IPP66_08750 [Anaerolineales bacterium]|nr:hypothetical protein [Anaerolineales bacterium]
MTIQNEDRDVTQSHNLDPFPEPRTIPKGWDMSALLSMSTIDSVTNEIDSADSESKA